MNDSPSHPVEKLDRSVSVAEANLKMLGIALPLILLLCLAYAGVWGLASLLNGLMAFARPVSLLASLFLGVPSHELIHGLSWAVFGRRPLRDVKFGFQLRSLTPYAHLRVPLPARAYRLGALMPALLLGFVPYLAGLALGNGWLLSFGLLYVFAAGGDLLVLWLLRDIPGGAWVEDHPSRAGCLVWRWNGE